MEQLKKFLFGRKYLCVLIAIILSTSFSTVLGQEYWTRYSDNPVLLPGDPGTWDDIGFINASVLIIGSTYRMWYTGIDGSNGRIGHATSPDGINWTKYPIPVLNLGDPGSWDDFMVCLPTVVYDGAIYHMWYCGLDAIPPAGNENIGHATSPDGINWTKDSLNPVLTTGVSGSWDAVKIETGFASKEGSTFHLWYNGGDGTAFRSGHATSPDGTNWTKDSLNPVLNVGSPSSWDYPTAQVSSIVYNPYNATYYMYYCGGEERRWSIGYATSLSLNGPWIKNPNNPNFQPSPSAWDSLYVCFPSVIYDGNTNDYKMWYNGNNTEWAGKIGLATAPVVPVELTSFTATANGNDVTLNWSTATELNNQGFEIQRSTEGKEFFTFGFVNGHGTTTEQQYYSYADKNLDNGKYYYRLKQVDYDGSYEYSGVVEIDLIAFSSYLLEQNYPNPFNPSTTIGFGIKEKSNVKITVLNSIGEEVAVVLNEEREPGFYQVEFNASSLPSGVYFYQLKATPNGGQAGSFVETKKMILLK